MTRNEIEISVFFGNLSSLTALSFILCSSPCPDEMLFIILNPFFGVCVCVSWKAELEDGGEDIDMTFRIPPHTIVP